MLFVKTAVNHAYQPQLSAHDYLLHWLHIISQSDPWTLWLAPKPLMNYNTLLKNHILSYKWYATEDIEIWGMDIHINNLWTLGKWIKKTGIQVMKTNWTLKCNKCVIGILTVMLLSCRLSDKKRYSCLLNVFYTEFC